eukprot:6178463-Pleurochrysis_carterae.AAC.3
MNAYTPGTISARAAGGSGRERKTATWSRVHSVNTHTARVRAHSDRGNFENQGKEGKKNRGKCRGFQRKTGRWEEYSVLT